MPLGYKYVERDADSQINWAEVGAETSGMLLEVNRVREEKKDALAKAQRESLNNLMNSPQGVDQSINSKINDFAHNLMEQKKIDYDLLTRGQMSVRDYTLKVQNQLDGTNNLFEVTKQLQATRQATLDGIAEGKYQAAGNIFNGGFVEKMSDLSNLSINVNSPNGEINLGMYEDKIIDGKKVRVVGKNIVTSNVLLGMVAQKIPTFYTDNQTTAWVNNMGSKKAAIYDAATTAGAGTISEYLGPNYLASIKDPVAKQIASDFNKSIDDLVASKIGGPTNSYNLMGVITADLGMYGSDDFTYDSDEAKADPNKILVKINQATHQMDLDETGANYERMKKEATEFVRNQTISKLDEEKNIKATPQNQLQERRSPTQIEVDLDKEKELSKNLAQNLVYSLTGDANKSKSGTQYLAATTGVFLNKETDGYTVTGKDNRVQTYKFKADGKTLADPVGFTKSFIGVIKQNYPNLNESQVLKYVKDFLPKGAQINLTTSAKGFDVQAPKKTAVQEFSSFIDKIPNVSQNKDVGQAVSELGQALEGTGFKVRKSLRGYIYLTSDDGAESKAYKVKDINLGLKNFKTFMKSNLPTKKIGTIKDAEAKAKELMESGVFGGGTATTTGGGELD